MSKPLVLIVGTGSREYREYLLRSIATEFDVHLFLGAEPEWERPYITGATVLADTLDPAVMIEAARRLDPAPDGVLCWDEARILQTAEVAAALGRPGGNVAAVQNCRDKHLTRAALAAAGVPQPESVLVGDVDAALAVAGRIGYPVVLKPRAMAASLGVVLAHDEQDVRDHFAFARDTTVPEAPAYDEAVLVEEFADGPEISVDCTVFHGEVTPYCVAHKQVGWEPYFEEVGHTVDGADPLLTDPELTDILRRAHAAVGITDALTHTEFRLTPRGPRLIEVNARIGGDLIPYLGLRTNGVDPGLAAAAVACGQAPRVEPGPRRAAAVAFGYVDEPTVIGSISFTEPLPPAVDRAVALLAPGAKTAPPPDGTLFGRTAFVTAVGDTVAECQAAVDQAMAGLTVTAAGPTEPSETSAPSEPSEPSEPTAAVAS